MFFKKFKQVKLPKQKILHKDIAIEKIKEIVYNNNEDWEKKIDLILELCDRAGFNPEQRSKIMANVCYEILWIKTHLKTNGRRLG